MTLNLLLLAGTGTRGNSISIVSKQRACFTQKKEKSKNCTNVHSYTYACFLVIYFYMVLLENGLLLHTCFLFLYNNLDANAPYLFLAWGLAISKYTLIPY